MTADNRDEFERLIKERNHLANLQREGDRYWILDYQLKWEGYQLRQPEIDALKAKVQEKIDNWFELLNKHDDLQRENQMLKAEVEKLRKDAEKSMSVHKTICDLMHNNIVAMQSAVIEWGHGRGADAGMNWIANTLFGPGLLPDENSPYGKEAQAWFDTNKSNPFPRCFCGRPSNILSMGRGFCSEEHYKQREEQSGDESNTGIAYHAAQLVLHSSPMLHHPPMDDDRTAITFWLPKSPDRREKMAQAFERIAHIFRNSPISGLD